MDTPAGLERAVAESNAVHLEVSAADQAALRDTLMSLDCVREVHCRADPGAVDRLSAECLVDSRDGAEAAIARAVAAHFALHRLERRRPTLENVFLHYVRESGNEQAQP